MYVTFVAFLRAFDDDTLLCMPPIYGAGLSGQCLIENVDFLLACV